METLVITVAAAMIVILEKDMFFETRHVGKLLAARYGETNVASVGKSCKFRTQKGPAVRIYEAVYTQTW